VAVFVPDADLPVAAVAGVKYLAIIVDVKTEWAIYLTGVPVVSGGFGEPVGAAGDQYLVGGLSGSLALSFDGPAESGTGSVDAEGTAGVLGGKFIYPQLTFLLLAGNRGGTGEAQKEEK
jgi:hypothetical protein